MAGYKVPYHPLCAAAACRNCQQIRTIDRTVTFFMGRRVPNQHCSGVIRGGREGNSRGGPGDSSVAGPPPPYYLLSGVICKAASPDALHLHIT